MNPDARVAVYYAPREDDLLFAAGSAWLGRNALLGSPVAQPPLPGIVELTAEPRVYGFHATLKPPMRLTADVTWAALLAAADGLAGQIAPFDLPSLAVSDTFGFLALRETASCPALQALADACVEQLDRFRMPPSDEELARRRRAPLSPAREAMLVRWGYPYVFATWFFHMTLTRHLTPSEHAIWHPRAEEFFREALAQPRRVTDICLFTQVRPGAPFAIAERLALRGRSNPRLGI